MSPSVHALVAARLGDVDLALRYFRLAAEIDLSNTMGNAAGGVHIAALGGLWQAAVLGFGGLRLREDGLAFDPHLPPEWRELGFSVRWRGRTVAVTVGRERVEAEVQGGGSMTLAIIDGPVWTAKPGGRYTVRRDRSEWSSWRELVG